MDDLCHFSFFIFFFFLSKKEMNFDPDKFVKPESDVNPGDVNHQIDEFEKHLGEEQNIVDSAIQESYKQITQIIDSQLQEIRVKEAEVNNEITKINQLVLDVQSNLPRQEEQKSTLTAVLEKRDLDALNSFIEENKDPNLYFPPIPNQQMSTLLSFIQQATFLVNKGNLVLEWIAACLMDIDMNHPLAKRFTPVLFKTLEDSVSNIQSKQARAVRYIISSLSIELP